MGRAYAEELALLDATYAHARAAEIAPLRESVDALRAKPLIIVGSGGSVSACHLAARLHETAARLSARVMTPLEFVQHPVPHDAGVLLLSASGANPDILAAATHAITAEYAPVVGLCTRYGTPLRAQLAAHRHAVVHEYAGPSAKDGFLATNSLLMTATLLARAYQYEPPTTLPSLSAPIDGAAGDGARAGTGGDSAPAPAVLAALGRRSLIVLANAWSTAAAYDLESKWAESGFATVTVTDARNFAHGRHYGLSRRLDETAVVGFATADDLGLNERTVAQLPPDACGVTVRSPLAGAAGALDLLVRVIRLAGAVGTARGVDPGRPRVPAFGRTLYHAGIPRRALAANHSPRRGTAGRTAGAPAPIRTTEDVWIRRKVTPAVWESAAPEAREHWRDCCRAWVGVVERMIIGGVVFDYDGTLCEADERFTTPAASVGAALGRLVDQGLVVGVATGRGDSVLEALRAVLPERLWGQIIVGMYNGGVVGTLADPPAVPDLPTPAIHAAHAALTASALLAAVASVKVQPTQLTVRARQPLPEGVLQRFVLEALGGSSPAMAPWVSGRADIGADAEPTAGATAHDGVHVFASSHTVDVIVGRASKLRVVAAVRDAIRAAGRTHHGAARSDAAAGEDAAESDPALAPAVMTIGDQGHLGGNDWPFLAQPLGLSVERVSSVFDGCWNVAPVGARRTAALHAYLSALAPDGQGTFRWTAARAFASSIAPTVASAIAPDAPVGLPRPTRPPRRQAATAETRDACEMRDAHDTPGAAPTGECTLAGPGR
jgi:fructoselysine-6-P-deglycase FrlB-like protein